MKKSFALLFLLMMMASCRSDSEDVQTIDQILQLFIKDSSGKDMLNSKIPGSYQSVSLFDLDGIRDQMPVSGYSLKKSTDTLTYLEYTAGATRILQDSISPESKVYRSDILLKLQKTSATDIDLDTMTVLYSWTAQKFEISKVNYNGKSVFRKVQGEPNRVTVVK